MTPTPNAGEPGTEAGHQMLAWWQVTPPLEQTTESFVNYIKRIEAEARAPEPAGAEGPDAFETAVLVLLDATHCTRGTADRCMTHDSARMLRPDQCVTVAAVRAALSGRDGS